MPLQTSARLCRCTCSSTPPAYTAPCAAGRPRRSGTPRPSTRCARPAGGAGGSRACNAVVALAAGGAGAGAGCGPAPGQLRRRGRSHRCRSRCWGLLSGAGRLQRGASHTIRTSSSACRPSGWASGFHASFLLSRGMPPTRAPRPASFPYAGLSWWAPAALVRRAFGSGGRQQSTGSGPGAPIWLGDSPARLRPAHRPSVAPASPCWIAAPKPVEAAGRWASHAHKVIVQQCCAAVASILVGRLVRCPSHRQAGTSNRPKRPVAGVSAMHSPTQILFLFGLSHTHKQVVSRLLDGGQCTRQRPPKARRRPVGDRRRQVRARTSRVLAAVCTHI